MISVGERHQSSRNLPHLLILTSQNKMIRKAPPKTLNLLFPQWQGSGTTNELYTGAMLLYERLQNGIEFKSVSVQPLEALKAERGILGYSQISEQLSAAHQIIQSSDPERIFTIGGDCSVDIAPVSFLNQKYGGDLAVVWLDAHGDLNTPASSPSGHFHGMPLRVLLGDGDETIVQSFSTLSPDQVFLVGARDFDLPEISYLKQANISLFPPQVLKENCQELMEAIALTNFNNLHIHFDLDVLDPNVFPFVLYPTAAGLSLEVLTSLLPQIQDQFNLVGFSITECAAVNPQQLAKIESIINCCQDFLEK